MTLSTRGQAHVQAMRQKQRTGRTKTVVLVFRDGSGNSTYQAVSVVWKQQAFWDLATLSVKSSAMPRGQEVVMEADIGVNVPGVAFVADTATPTAAAVAAAVKYEIVERHAPGIVPGGTRWFVQLRQLR